VKSARTCCAEGSVVPHISHENRARRASSCGAQARRNLRLNRVVLRRASEPFPTQIRTLDAIHIASALLVQTRKRTLYFATHDADMATAALAMGLRVIGAESTAPAR
jgi:hypothetical protein